MKKVLLSVLASFAFCLQAQAAVDLFDPSPQQLPDDVSQVVYQSLAKEVQENCIGLGTCKIELRNFYCESFETPITKPTYTCSYGLNDKFQGDNADRIYQALVRAGFISDCDNHDGTCDIDPISSISCRTTNSYYRGQSFSCIIKI
jgi:hypothetical protein